MNEFFITYKKMNNLTQIIFSYLKKEKKLTVWYVILTIISEGAFLSSPFVMAAIIDQINAKQFDSMTYRYAAIWIIISLVDEL